MNNSLISNINFNRSTMSLLIKNYSITDSYLWNRKNNDRNLVNAQNKQTNKQTHTHTHTQRERERERERTLKNRVKTSDKPLFWNNPYFTNTSLLMGKISPFGGNFENSTPPLYKRRMGGGGGGVQQLILCFYTKKNWEL